MFLWIHKGFLKNTTIANTKRQELIGKMLILTDNCTCQKKIPYLRQSPVFPSNIVSLIHLMDHGIIANLKVYFRQLTMDNMEKSYEKFIREFFL